MKLNVYDYKYYLEFTRGVWKYKLVYVPGDIVDLPGSTEYPLPKGCIDKELTIDAGFTDELPIGMVESIIMNFTLDLKTFRGVYNVDVNNYIDYEELRQTLINTYRADANGDPIYYVFLGVTTNVIIPNRWYLLSNNGVGSSYTTLEYHGIQDVKPDKKFDCINEFWDITLVDIHSACLKASLGKDLSFPFKPNQLTPGDRVLDIGVYADSGMELLEDNEAHFQMVTFKDLFTYIDVAKLLHYRFYLRSPLSSAIPAKDYSNNVFSHIQFYENPHGRSGGIGYTLNYDDLYFIGYNSPDGKNPIGGELDKKNDVTSALQEYETLKDLYAHWTDGNCSKAVIKFDISELIGDTHYIKWYPILSPTNGTTKTLTSRNIIKDTFDLSTGVKIANGSTSHIYTTGGDRENYTERVYGLLSEQSDESQVVFHNCSSLFNNKDKNLIEKPDDTEYANFWKIHLRYEESPRKIYYLYSMGFDGAWDGVFKKVHDEVTIDLGSHDGVETNVISHKPEFTNYQYPPVTGIVIDGISTDFTNPDPLENFKEWFALYRYSYLSMPRLIAQAKVRLLCNRKTAIIECTCDSSEVSVHDIGHTFNIDLNDITGLNYLNPPYSTKGILTSIKTDVYKGTSECKFWLRGF